MLPGEGVRLCCRASTGAALSQRGLEVSHIRPQAPAILPGVWSGDVPRLILQSCCCQGPGLCTGGISGQQPEGGGVVCVSQATGKPCWRAPSAPRRVPPGLPLLWKEQHRAGRVGAAQAPGDCRALA